MMKDNEITTNRLLSTIIEDPNNTKEHHRTTGKKLFGRTRKTIMANGPKPPYEQRDNRTYQYNQRDNRGTQYENRGRPYEAYGQITRSLERHYPGTCHHQDHIVHTKGAQLLHTTITHL